MTLTERIERGELIVSVNRTVSELPGVVHAEDKVDRDELLRLARIGEREQWVAVSEGLPEIDYTKPQYARYVAVIVVGINGFIGELHYSVNSYAKTERGKAPAWKHPSGRKYDGKVSHWRPLPLPPGGAE